MGVIDELKHAVKGHILTKEEELLPYKTDASYFSGSKPMAVLLPSDVSEVSNILKICNREGINVISRGGGTSLTGSATVLTNSIVLAMTRMNRIIHISSEDRYAIVEPGVRIDDLNYELSEIGFMYPPDPGSSIAATVGGSISTNAGGLRGVMYGSTKEWVLGLQVVLSDGTVIETGGRVLKRSAGYDLTALFVGSEGTLGIITLATLKITPLPERIGRVIAFYDSIERAGAATAIIKKSGLTPITAEFMDKVSLDSISKNMGLSFSDSGNSDYMLIVDIASTDESLNRHLEKALSLIKGTGPRSVRIIYDETEIRNITNSRKGLYSSILSERDKEGQYAVMGDIVVPPSTLSNALLDIRNLVGKYGFKVALFGHIGDGNIHANIIVNPSDAKEMERVSALMNELGRIALINGGSVSAEHGIGLEKKRLLRMEMEYKESSRNIELMTSIKAVFDKKGILNRGKLL
ncbi:MAG: FAD-binding oxidoreductase [Thermoplasmatales archaeon]|nr:FAD-binding oxidoreductase [Thermoplasmatales archaeon]